MQQAVRQQVAAVPFSHRKDTRCQTQGCRQTRGRSSRYCSRCRHDREKQKDPIRYAFNTLKRNAKRRGKVFTITLEDFTEFCHKTQYIYGKGKTKDALTIDRIDPTKGYEKGNLKAISNSENVRKYWRFDFDEMTGQLNFFPVLESKTTEFDPTSDIPF